MAIRDAGTYSWEDLATITCDGPSLLDRGDCPRCGDPLPVDGECDCAGDADRDMQTGWAELAAHPMIFRIGDSDELGEVWV